MVLGSYYCRTLDRRFLWAATVLPIVFGSFSLTAYAQSVLPTEPPASGTGLNGFRFNEISFSSIFADINYPVQSGTTPPSQNVLLGVGGNFSWTVSREKTNFLLSYSPSYLSNLSYSAERGANHSLTMSLNRKLGAKWAWNASAAGAITSLSQFMFNPSQMSQLVSTPASFDQLAASILTGTSSNLQLNNLANAAPVLDSPSAAALLGDRFFSASATTGLSYSPSTRLTIAWNATASRVQPLRSGNENLNQLPIQRAMVLGQTGLSVTYSLNPRTEIGVMANASRSLDSGSPRTYAETGTLTLSRTMSRRWFLNAAAGGGYMKNILQAGNATGGPQYIYTGGIGFKSYAHTLMISYSRSLNNSGLALAAGVFHATTAAWNWSRPGSNWSLQVSSSYQQQTYSGTASFNSWNSLAGLSRALSQQTAIQLAYSVGELGNPGYMNNIMNDKGRYNAVRISFEWSPQATLIR